MNPTGEPTASSPVDSPAEDWQAAPGSEHLAGSADEVGDSEWPAALASVGADLPDEAGLPDELAILTKERDDYLDMLRRLQADFDNYRKREKANVALEVGRSTEKVISRLIPVLDTFELALGHETDPNASSLAKVHDQLLGALEAEGLERLAPTGEPFDPADAEAVMHEPGEGDGGQIVSEVLRAGYRWKGRVIRAAMVKVKG